MGFLTPHRGTQRSFSVSERNHTQLMGVCVLEDVSRSCKHQHSLSVREAFSIRPSLTRKYSNFVLAVVISTPSQLERYSPPSQFLTEVLELRIGKQFGEYICNMLMCRKVLHMYYFPLHHVSDIMIFYLNVFRT
jgi:hypothetical protein